MLAHKASDETPRLRVRVPPPENSGVSACGAEIGADRPGFESWSLFCFQWFGLSFPICKVGLPTPCRSPEGVTGTQGGRGWFYEQ